MTKQRISYFPLDKMDDAMRAEMDRCFIALTMGQQSWLRLLDIEHQQVMSGSAGSMAPGFESAEALAKAKASPDYWAKQEAKPGKSTA